MRIYFQCPAGLAVVEMLSFSNTLPHPNFELSESVFR
jgi:hypothetical protein